MTSSTSTIETNTRILLQCTRSQDGKGWHCNVPAIEDLKGLIKELEASLTCAYSDQPVLDGENEHTEEGPSSVKPSARDETDVNSNSSLDTSPDDPGDCQCRIRESHDVLQASEDNAFPRQGNRSRNAGNTVRKSGRRSND